MQFAAWAADQILSKKINTELQQHVCLLPSIYAMCFMSQMTPAEDDVVPSFVGKQTKNEKVDRLLWRGVLQGHHSSYTCHLGSATNAWGAHVGFAHSARRLLQSHGLSDNSISMCPGPGSFSICLSHWSCHFQVTFIIMPMCGLHATSQCCPVHAQNACSCWISAASPAVN